MSESEVKNPVADAADDDADVDQKESEVQAETGTGIYLEGGPGCRSIHMAAVRAAVNPNVSPLTKVLMVALSLFVTLCEFRTEQGNGPDHTCETQYTCYEGTVCYKHKDEQAHCQWCGDFYVVAADGSITYRSHVLEDDDDESEAMDMENPFEHPYAGMHLSGSQRGNTSFVCPPDDPICQQCFDLKTREFVPWDGMDHATDLVLAMTNGNWVGCLCLSFVAAMSCAMAIGDITQMRMIMNREGTTRGPFGLVMEFVLVFRHLMMSFGAMFGVFANVHHVDGGDPAMVAFAIMILWIHSMSRVLYILLPEPLRKQLEDESPPIEATPEEVKGLYIVRYIYVPYMTFGPWLALILIQTPDWGPVMPIFFGQFLLILLTGLAHGEPLPKQMGLQFGRLLLTFVIFFMVMLIMHG